MAAQAADRAASFASGVTESSRSITISSAGSDRALASIFSEEAGTERQERRDLTRREHSLESASLVPRATSLGSGRRGHVEEENWKRGSGSSATVHISRTSWSATASTMRRRSPSPRAMRRCIRRSSATVCTLAARRRAGGRVLGAGTPIVAPGPGLRRRDRPVDPAHPAGDRQPLLPGPGPAPHPVQSATRCELRPRSSGCARTGRGQAAPRPGSPPSGSGRAIRRGERSSTSFAARCCRCGTRGPRPDTRTTSRRSARARPGGGSRRRPGGWSLDRVPRCGPRSPLRGPSRGGSVGRSRAATS